MSAPAALGEARRWNLSSSDLTFNVFYFRSSWAAARWDTELRIIFHTSCYFMLLHVTTLVHRCTRRLLWFVHLLFTCSLYLLCCCWSSGGSSRVGLSVFNILINCYFSVVPLSSSVAAAWQEAAHLRIILISLHELHWQVYNTTLNLQRYIFYSRRWERSSSD